MEKRLKSYRVFAQDGSQVFTVIASDIYDTAELNDLFRKGMKVTAVDQRSALVDKNFVDKE